MILIHLKEEERNNLKYGAREANGECQSKTYEEIELLMRMYRECTDKIVIGIASLEHLTFNKSCKQAGPYPKLP